MSNLRCHRSARWRCAPGLNMALGENGSGKTTLLEAVYIMGHGRSFRQARDPALCRIGCGEFTIRGQWRRYGPLAVDVFGGGGGMRIHLQGRKLRQRSELSGTLPVIVESPQGPKLADGVPGERRRWLDQLMLHCRPDVARHYSAYLRCLMQRSRLVRRGGSAAELETWERRLVVHGLEIMRARTDVLADMNRVLTSERTWVESELCLQIRHLAPQDEERWMAQLAEQRKKGKVADLHAQGPHCDRLLILYGERDVRICGSRGQQKLTAMALRMAECNLRLQARGLAPLLLLDDCFEALDPIRRRRLLDRLAACPGQILMTGPSGSEFARDRRIHYHILPSTHGRDGGGVKAKVHHSGMEAAA